MLFRKNIEPSCSYCRHGNKINEDEIQCSKRGVKDLYSSCSSFSYDPLKREPPRPSRPLASKFSENDFKL